MSSINVSVILPSVSDSAKLNRFCTTLFSGKLSIELIVCSEADNAVFGDISQEYVNYIRVVNSAIKVDALKNALEASQGKFIIISDENVIFAPNSIEKMIVASSGKMSVCNAAIVSGEESRKLFADKFTITEASQNPVAYNFLLSGESVRKNKIYPCGTDNLSLMLFIADCLRYEQCFVINEVLMYSDSSQEVSFSEAVGYLSEYAEIFAKTGNDVVSMFFINSIYSLLLNNLNSETYEYLKSVLIPFKDNDLIIQCIRFAFRIDTDMLCDENSDYGDFEYNGENVFYKEVTLPFLPDNAIRNFYSGKFGIDVLKKCVGAWLYYKFYRRKDDFIKKVGCKLSCRLLGGDFVG